MTKITLDAIINGFFPTTTSTGKSNVIVFLTEKRRDGSYNNYSARVVGDAASKFLGRWATPDIFKAWAGEGNFAIFKTADGQATIDTQQIKATPIKFENGNEVRGNEFNASLMQITVFDFELDERVKGQGAAQGAQQAPQQQAPQQQGQTNAQYSAAMQPYANANQQQQQSPQQQAYNPQPHQAQQPVQQAAQVDNYDDDIPF